jgi:uncharacterized LabA/DUF88 family protein
MSENILKIDQKTAVLVDGNNIERALIDITRKEGTMIDFDRVIPDLLEGRHLARLIYFREGESISDKLAQRLQERFHGSVQACGKGADIPLTIRAIQLAPKVDSIIIMSGDADYIELVRHLRGEGVRVEIASVKGSTSQALVAEADRYHEIDEDDAFVFANAKRSRRRGRR